MMFTFRRSLLSVSFIALLSMPAYAQQGQGYGANYETRLSSLEDQLRAMNGRLEQVEFNLRRLEQSMQRLQSDVDGRLSRLESSPAPTAAAVAPPPPLPTTGSNMTASGTTRTTTTTVYAPAAQAEPPPSPPSGPVNGTLGSLRLQDGKVTGGSVNPQQPPLPETPPDYGLTSQEQYDRAFDLLRQADYEEAGTAFEAFINKNPQDKLVDNAKYWYGETLYVRGQFDAAAVAFADAYQQNPQGTKAPDSLLKLGMSLEALGKTSDACATLDSLKSKYPNATSTIRQRADQERGKMKCNAATNASTAH